MPTWILVADEARARVLEVARTSDALVERMDFVHVEGRQHSRDVIRDHLPRSQESMGSARHAIEPHTDLETLEARRFAGELAAALYAARVDRKFDRLLLVAPPRFLGALRAALSKDVTHCVIGSLDKDVTREPIDAIRERVKALL